MTIRGLFLKIGKSGKKLLLLNDTPQGIALGFALGLFLSVIPTFGIGMIAALALAPLLKANLISTYAGTLVVNPVTGVFFYAADFFVGNKLLGDPVSIELPRTLAQAAALAAKAPLPLYVGGVVLAAVLSILSYASLFMAVRWYQRRTYGKSG